MTRTQHTRASQPASTSGGATTRPAGETERLAGLYAERVRDAAEGDPALVARWDTLAARLVERPGGGRDELVVPPLPLAWSVVGALLAAGTHLPAEITVHAAPGEPNRCYENAARGWLAGRWDAIGLGYGLGPGDGLWRGHAVGVSLDGTGAPSALHETTVGRDRYFLAVLGERECAGLFLDQVDEIEVLDEGVPSRVAVVCAVITELLAAERLDEASRG